MSCGQCNPDDCIAPKGWVCKESGDFYTTGEYSSTINFFNIHGVSLNQKIDSVKELLDYNTLQILKVLLFPNRLSVYTQLSMYVKPWTLYNQGYQMITKFNQFLP